MPVYNVKDQSVVPQFVNDFIYGFVFFGRILQKNLVLEPVREKEMFLRFLPIDDIMANERL
jgi:hypothetical protein